MRKLAGYSIFYLVIIFVITCLFGVKGLDLYQSLFHSNLMLLLVAVIFYLLKLALHLID